MDRAIDTKYLRWQLVRRITLTLLIIAVLVGSSFTAWAWLKPSISRVRIRTAQVKRGALESTITASGTVLPELEQVISSPIDARVIKILKRPGAKIRKNEAILQLDVNASILELDKINQQLLLKENSQKKTKLDLIEKLNGLQSQAEMKQLEWESFKAQTIQQRKLFEMGLSSENAYRQAQLQEDKALIELKQLETTKKNSASTSEIEMAGLDLDIKTLLKEREEASRQLDLATTRSDRDGVLTWVVLEEGATIHKGDIIARIADLNSFKIEATVSDIHAKELLVGQKATIKINEDYLSGLVTNILPTVKDGAITFAIRLDHSSSPLLYPNLRVDVLIMKDKKDDVLTIKKGPFINGDGKQDVFVIRGDRAYKVPVIIGISSFENCEVVDGLLENDEVIISDMRDYLYLKELQVK